MTWRAQLVPAWLYSEASFADPEGPLTPFVEERLELGALYGTDGGPQFRTTVVRAYSGKEYRNADWSTEGGRWVLGAHRVTRTQLAYVQAFFRARRGMAVGFRWRNYADYVLPKTAIGMGDGQRLTFQIVQRAATGFGEVYSRPIRKPVGGTVTVYVADAPVASGWSVDLATGVVSFVSPPAADAEVAVQCEFDTPVRFETDSLAGVFLAWRASDGEVAYEIAGLPVIEDRFA